jgi:RNA polymerase-binding transcription factor DksA
MVLAVSGLIGCSHQDRLLQNELNEMDAKLVSAGRKNTAEHKSIADMKHKLYVENLSERDRAQMRSELASIRESLKKPLAKRETLLTI